MAGPIRGMQKLTEEDAARAAELIGQGLSPDAVRARLVDGGLSPGLADQAIEVAVERRLSAESFEMLRNGAGPNAAKAFLVGKGVSPFVADEVIQAHLITIQSMKPGPGAVRKIVGGCVVALGIALILANVAVGFRLFPFAGFLFLFIGFAIMGR